MNSTGVVGRNLKDQHLLTVICRILFAVVKPLVADGSAKSHAMALAYDPFGLSSLDTPLVLQEFVNHGESREFFLLAF